MNSIIAWLVDALIRNVSIQKSVADAAANTASFVYGVATGSANGPKALTTARVAVQGGFTCDGTDFFTLTVSSIDPVTGTTRDTATASFANTTATDSKWASVALSAPLTVKAKDIVKVAITKNGAGKQLGSGVIQIGS